MNSKKSTKQTTELTSPLKQNQMENIQTQELTFLSLARDLIAQSSQPTIKKILKSISKLTAAAFAETENILKTKTAQESLRDNSRMQDLVSALEMLSARKKQLPDPRNMNQLDFKKHMDYGRVINQLTALKHPLENLQNN